MKKYVIKKFLNLARMPFSASHRFGKCSNKNTLVARLLKKRGSNCQNKDDCPLDKKSLSLYLV